MAPYPTGPWRDRHVGSPPGTGAEADATAEPKTLKEQLEEEFGEEEKTVEFKATAVAAAKTLKEQLEEEFGQKEMEVDFKVKHTAEAAAPKTLKELLEEAFGQEAEEEEQQQKASRPGTLRRAEPEADFHAAVLVKAQAALAMDRERVDELQQRLERSDIRMRMGDFAQRR